MVKPSLSNKVVSNEKITLVENEKIVENDKNTASALNEFFSNTITTLGIPQYNETEPVSYDTGDALMKAFIKHRFHPSIIAIKKNCNSGLSFNFSQAERDEIIKEITNLKTNKATQSIDITQNLLRKILISLELLFLEIVIIPFPILLKLLEKCNHNTSS